MKTTPIDPRQMVKFIGVVLACSGIIWVATSMRTERDAGLRDAEVLVDLRSTRAIFNDAVRSVKVGLLDSPDSESATEALIPLLERDSRIEWQRVNALSVRNGILHDFNVLLVPGGSGRLKAEDLGDGGRTMIREFVNHGGGYVGICGGAFLATSGYDWGLGLIDAATLTGMIECGQEGARSAAARGSGVVSVEFSGLSKGVFAESLSPESVQYSSGPIFRRGIRSELPAFVVLAWFRTEVYECPSQRGTMVNTPAIIASKFGKGTVLLFSPHPETSPHLEHVVIDAITGCGDRSVVRRVSNGIGITERAGSSH
ncbi:MAG: BPL-N domain-containing protein [Planctomycetota bacterium]